MLKSKKKLLNVHYNKYIIFVFYVKYNINIF